MPATIYLTDLLLAMEWVSAATYSENRAYVSRETGRIFWDPEAAGLDDELPADVEDESLYVPVPGKNDLDLGQAVVFRFIEANEPDAYEQVRSYFSRKGAYARFKDFLDRRGLLDAWHAYQDAATEAALREWAQGEGFEPVAGERAER